jgi:tRNA(Ile)-lysidine synthase TilS/MesJ
MAEAHGFTNKLRAQLGHNMDDILETLFMNMMKKGEFPTMPTVMPYKKYSPHRSFGPLSLCEERQIIGCATSYNLTSFTCSCSINLEGETQKD